MDAAQIEPAPVMRSLADRYEIVRKIGEGASAETWLAHDRENGSDPVVIKSLHVEKLEGWKFFELFEREARTLSSLRYAGVPHFVEWFASQEEDGRTRFHIVQEYIEGRSLEEVIEQGGMSEAEFDQLALGLLDILHHLHGRTPPVYHRDIKPSNIIVGPMGAPVLIDFGSVCYGWREDDERGSTVAGTHGYMPPEQYMGQVSARSDLYGLGATLLHVASGRAPSEFSFDDGRINVPESLSVRPAVRNALSKMLEPAPRDRPQNAREARELFIASDTAMVAVERESTALTVRPQDVAVFFPREDAPTFVDLGPPPRDPKGEFKDVFLSLHPPFVSINTGAEGVNRANKTPVLLMVLVFTLLSFSTFGLWPLIQLAGKAQRERRAELFRTGLFTRGTIAGIAAQNQMSNRVTYEFDVERQRFRASELVASADSSHMLPGDVLGVLYEPGNPGNSTVVYR